MYTLRAHQESDLGCRFWRPMYYHYTMDPEPLNHNRGRAVGKAARRVRAARYDGAMRLRVLLPVFAVTAAVLVLPYTVFAQTIPFFGPIVPTAINKCPGSFALFITVINNLIIFLLTIAIVFIAPLMIAYSGFLFVVNPVNPSGKEKAKTILWNTIFGIVIALAGWLIVDGIMAVLYSPPTDSNGTKWGTWYSLVTGSGDPCLIQAGSLYDLNGVSVTGATATSNITVVPGACSVPPLSPLTDRLALQMESGGEQTVIWTNTDPRLQACANKFIRIVGGAVTSAYRPQQYQTHLWEIADRWCTQGLQSNSDSACSSLKSTVSTEVAKHQIVNGGCGPVASSASTHGSGPNGSTAVDISSSKNGSQAAKDAAAQSCLTWPIPSDLVHYVLNSDSNCTCR